MSARAGGDDEGRQREAERLDRRVLRLDQSPGCRLQDAQHDQPEARGRQDRADEVEPWLGTGARRVLDDADHGEDDEHEHDLADEHDPPRELCGGPAAEDRADGDAGPATPPITA